MIYSCNICNFKCNRKVDYNRHLLTKKHNKRINNILPTNDVDDNDKKNKNNFISIDEIYENECSDDSCIKISNQIIMKLLKDNEEMKKIIIEQNKQQTQIMIQQQQQQQQQQEQQQQIIEMLPKICIGNITNNNNTTNIKQKFNLNFFLNEQCKDAISLCDFVKSLNITFDDLSVTREKNLEESVGSIFMRGLKDLDVFKRPIHCTDTKRDIMYIKDEDIWKKDEGNEKIKSSINEISRKHVKVLKELKDSDPEIKTNELKRDDFILTMNHVCTPIPDSGEKRIIKTISKEVTVTSV
jgi:ribosomal protein L35